MLELKKEVTVINENPEKTIFRGVVFLENGKIVQYDLIMIGHWTTWPYSVAFGEKKEHMAIQYFSGLCRTNAYEKYVELFFDVSGHEYFANYSKSHYFTETINTQKAIGD